MTEPRIVVVGSANVDLIMKMDRLPRVGESVTDAEFIQTFGGKGANQAVAACRSGGSVGFVGCVGEDALGDEIKTNLREFGVDTTHLLSTPLAASGTALIMIGPGGENYLSVAPGANYTLTSSQVDAAWSMISGCEMVLVQDEIPLDTIRHVIERSHEIGIPVMFNVAPARNLGDMPLEKVAFLLVNETEAAFLTRLPVDNEEQAWAAVDGLLAKGSKTIILTMGAAGCLVAGSNFTSAGNQALRTKIPAYQVDAVDTTAAGDVFCGVLSAAIVEGKTLIDSLRFASAASALCVTRLGAQPSIPDRSEIEAFIKMNEVPA